MRRTDKTLLAITAEWTEATYSSLRKEEDHYYVRKPIGTEEQKRAKHKSTVHFSSINIRDK